MLQRDGVVVVPHLGNQLKMGRRKMFQSRLLTGRRGGSAGVLSGMAIAAAVAVMGMTGLDSAAAQADYPSKPIRLLVPWAAGGGGDTIARQAGRAIEPILGQPVVIENKPGAAGIIGAEEGSKATPDGYTILIGNIGTHGTHQFLQPSLPYDPAADFAPISLLTKTNNVLVVPAASPYQTLQDLIDDAKSRPGELTTGIPSIGDTAHLGWEMLKRDAGLDVVAIPYTSVSAPVVDLLGGRLDFLVASISSQAENIKAGNLRALATTDAERSPVLPDVPTVAESGFPGFTAIGWIGLFAPAETPPEIVEKLSSAVREAYQKPDVIAELSAAGDPVSSTPEEFDTFMKAERVKWAKVIEEAEIKLEQ